MPEDVSVVGFDDVPEAGYLYPPLTTVRQDFATLGELIMQKVLIALEEDEPATPGHAAADAARGARVDASALGTRGDVTHLDPSSPTPALGVGKRR